MEASSLDQGFFTWDADSDTGLTIVHVDDLMFGGDSSFHEKVISPIEQTFSISTRNMNCFTYTGKNIVQLSDKSIQVNQHSYASTIQPLNFLKNQSDKTPLTPTEKSQFRSIVGQLNWLSGVTRPDISFEVSQLSAVASRATVGDAKLLNKVVKKVHGEQLSISYPPLNLKSLSIVVYSDASHGNLPDGGSQGGNIIFITDGSKSAPLQWTSQRLKRVVRSTLAAEALALLAACDSAIYLKTLVESTPNVTQLPAIKCIIDNKSCYDNIFSSKPVLEQRLRIDIAAIREMVTRKEVTVVWKEKKHQLADCLTKRGANSQRLTECLKMGNIH